MTPLPHNYKQMIGAAGADGQRQEWRVCEMSTKGEMTRWGFSVKGGLIDKLQNEYRLHAATASYTLNEGIKARLLEQNKAVAKQLEYLTAAPSGKATND